MAQEFIALPPTLTDTAVYLSQQLTIVTNLFSARQHGLSKVEQDWIRNIIHYSQGLLQSSLPPGQTCEGGSRFHRRLHSLETANATSLQLPSQGEILNSQFQIALQNLACAMNMMSSCNQPSHRSSHKTTSILTEAPALKKSEVEISSFLNRRKVIQKVIEADEKNSPQRHDGHKVESQDHLPLAIDETIERWRFGTEDAMMAAVKHLDIDEDGPHEMADNSTLIEDGLDRSSRMASNSRRRKATNECERCRGSISVKSDIDVASTEAPSLSVAELSSSSGSISRKLSGCWSADCRSTVASIDTAATSISARTSLKAISDLLPEQRIPTVNKQTYSQPPSDIVTSPWSAFFTPLPHEVRGHQRPNGASESPTPTYGSMEQNTHTLIFDEIFNSFHNPPAEHTALPPSGPPPPPPPLPPTSGSSTITFTGVIRPWSHLRPPLPPPPPPPPPSTLPLSSIPYPPLASAQTSSSKDGQAFYRPLSSEQASSHTLPPTSPDSRSNLSSFPSLNPTTFPSSSPSLRFAGPEEASLDASLVSSSDIDHVTRRFRPKDDSELFLFSHPPDPPPPPPAPYNITTIHTSPLGFSHRPQHTKSDTAVDRLVGQPPPPDITTIHTRASDSKLYPNFVPLAGAQDLVNGNHHHRHHNDNDNDNNGNTHNPALFHPQVYPTNSGPSPSLSPSIPPALSQPPLPSQSPTPQPFLLPLQSTKSDSTLPDPPRKPSSESSTGGRKSRGRALLERRAAMEALET